MLESFIQDFALPLHAGGPVKVGKPFGLKDLENMMGDGHLLLDSALQEARQRRAAQLLCDSRLEDPNREDLALWLGLHNLLVLDHPDVDRVWTRAGTWEIVAKTTRALVYSAAPTDLGDQLARHVSVSAFLGLERRDEVARLGEEVRRYRGRAAPRSVRRMASIGELELSEEKVPWIEQEHAGWTELTLPDLFAVSPLTSLLHPGYAPKGFDPLSPSRWLRARGPARAIVYAWAKGRDWVSLGATLTASMLRALGHGELVAADDAEVARAAKKRPPGVEEEGPEGPEAPDLSEALAIEGTRDYGLAEHAALLGALIHLHLLKVLSYEARVGLGGRARRAATRAFLSLPLMLPTLSEALGDPLVGIEDRDALRRWDEYLSHLRGLVPADHLENLVAALAAPVVQGEPA